MSRILIVLVALILGIHGLIHMIGATVCLKLGDVQGLAYKTTVLGGRVDLGDGGIRVFGALWILPAIGFVISGADSRVVSGALRRLRRPYMIRVRTVLSWSVTRATAAAC